MDAAQPKPLLYLRAMRPQQWLKNGFVLAPVVFAEQFFATGAWIHGLAAAGAFCLAASAIYLINDLKDIEEDRAHPRKRHRPLASGAMVATEAVVLALLLVVGAGVVGAGAGFAFGFSTAGTGAPMRTGDASGASSLRNGLGPVGSVLAGPGPGPGPAGFALEVGLPLAANAASSFRRSVRVSDSNVGRTTRDDERAGSSFVRGGDGVDLGASGAGMNVMSEATL